MSLKVLELFGGIGACTTALKRLGIDYEVVDYVEIDKYAVASYNAINGTNFEPQDITTWDKDMDVDLIMHGSPCQDFSLAGKQAGGDEGSGTRSSLMYETLRIVNKLKPKYVIWENVKNLISKKHKHNFDKYVNIMNEGGYDSYYQVLNSKDYGIPQNRERVFTISIRRYEFPKKEELKYKLKDFLENNVDEKYYISEKGIRYITSEKRLGTFTNLNPDLAITLTAKGQNNWTGSFVSEQTGYIEKGTGKHQSNTVYNSEKISPCLNACDYKEPIKILIKNATKKGYDEAIEGDSIDLTYPNSETRRGRVGHQVSQTIPASDTKGVVVIGNYMPSNHDASRIVDNNGVAPTVKENHGTVTATIQDLRIRKLTPKECWRLMGFNDEEFEKAEAVNSNTQLYKQAGNSIVVNVLEGILNNLITNNYKKEDVERQISLF